MVGHVIQGNSSMPKTGSVLVMENSSNEILALGNKAERRLTAVNSNTNMLGHKLRDTLGQS